MQQKASTTDLFSFPWKDEDCVAHEVLTGLVWTTFVTDKHGSGASAIEVDGIYSTKLHQELRKLIPYIPSAGSVL